MLTAPHTKIVATLGPSSDTEEKIDALFRAGADVFRLNFSHGTQEYHAQLYRRVLAVEERHARPIGIFADLQGPKLRIGEFANGPVTLEPGSAFRLDRDSEPGNERRVELPHPEIFSVLREGMPLLLDDGKIRLEVTDWSADHAETQVVLGGILSNHKGVNVPKAVLDVRALTEKDANDLAFAVGLGIRMFALSFVQGPEDIRHIRERAGEDIKVIAKLERPAAVDHLHAIIEAADAVMVARGDLGVELPPEDVPTLQRKIVGACRVAGKPVVVATQMLDSMVSAPTPTRAEASDVATAVYEGADAVMLSAESAAGQFPVEAVGMMDRIIRKVESDPSYSEIIRVHHMPSEKLTSDAITSAARQVAETLSAAAIVTFTTSGWTTLRASRSRPMAPILALTPRKDTARILTLAWGVHPMQVAAYNVLNDLIAEAVRRSLAVGGVNKGDRLVVTAGHPLGTPGMTNVLRVVTAE